MTQKDPGGDVIEDIEGQRLIDLIEESGSMAVYFCKFCIFHRVGSHELESVVSIPCYAFFIFIYEKKNMPIFVILTKYM